MNDFFKRNGNSRILRLEIAFRLDQCKEWAINNCEGDLGSTAMLDEDWFKEDLATIKYNIDIIPYSEATTGCYFYHQTTNSFSDSIGAFEYFGETFYRKFPEMENVIRGVEWKFHASGYLNLAVLTGMENCPFILTIPTDEIIQLQGGEKILKYGIDCSVDPTRRDELSKQMVRVELSPGQFTAFGRLKLGCSGANGEGLLYRNNLCQIKIGFPGLEMNYSQS